MTKQVNAIDKPSSTQKPVDKGGKSKVRQEDKEYKADQPKQENIGKRHEKEEQPVGPGKGVWSPESKVVSERLLPFVGLVTNKRMMFVIRVITVLFAWAYWYYT